MRVRWLGRVPYREAWDLQRAISSGTREDYLLLLEHPSVFTLGAHADPAHVLDDPSAVGAELVRVDRGGDVTFHGPGQLVGYPLLSVGAGPHQGREHVRRLEDVLIAVLVALGLPAASVGRLEGYPGVWAGLDEPSSPAGAGEDPSASPPLAGPRKICAIGVRTARGRTTHGFALNVDPDLGMFDHIVPCGIADRPVTSLRAEGVRATMGEVVDAVVAAAEVVWGPATDRQQVTDGARSGDAPVPSTPAVEPSPGPTGAVPSPTPVTLLPGPPGEGALSRRLRRAGVDPDAGLPVGERKPSWLRVRAHMGEGFLKLRHGVRDLGLVTVCEEAGCPNIFECWSDGTATFMINGSRCTRACAFCLVDTAHPRPLDPEEPERVAAAVERMGLAHAVVTCVARDDLDDGGAGAFAATVAAIRRRTPGTAVEVLISDLKGDAGALQTVIDAGPDVCNHNIETVARLQRAVRPSAGYARSLTVLARSAAAGLTTKSGLIVGMGEEDGEVLSTLADLRAVGVDIVTIGQYLRPSAAHLPVARWWTPSELDTLAEAGMAMGFAHVQASPLTRSSYHARQAATEAGQRQGDAAGVPA